MDNGGYKLQVQSNIYLPTGDVTRLTKLSFLDVVVTNVIFKDTKTLLRLITFKRQNVTPFVITSIQIAILGGHNVILSLVYSYQNKKSRVYWCGIHWAIRK